MPSQLLVKIILISAFASMGLGRHADAASFTPGNLLLTERGPTGPALLMEYARSGNLIQQISIPSPPGIGTNNTDTRDVTTDQAGNAYVVLDASANDGTTPRYIAKYAAGLGEWSYYPIPGFKFALGYAWEGSVDVYGNYLYCQSQSPNSVRFDITDFSSTASPASSVMSLGFDGKLYNLLGEGSGYLIRVYDPVTLVQQKEIPLSSNYAALAINNTGEIFAAINSHIFKLNADGTVARSLLLGNYQVYDLDLSTDGTLLATTRFGTIFTLDQSLSQASVASFTLPSNLQWPTFGGFVATVPEPSILVFLGIGAFRLMPFAFRQLPR